MRINSPSWFITLQNNKNKNLKGLSRQIRFALKRYGSVGIKIKTYDVGLYKTNLHSLFDF